jgi:spermidine/putrescine transport system substrate-binding protein
VKKISRRSFLTIAAVSPIAVLSGCSSDAKSTDAAVSEAAGTEAATATEAMAAETTAAMAAETTAAAAAGAGVTGTLNFLNFTGWAGPTTYADFAKAFPGAKVNEIAWASADDTIAKAKDRAGDIDLVLVDGTTFPRLTAIGVLAPLGDVANLSLVADQYKNTVWDPKNESFAATDHGRTGFVYRKDLLKETPTSWKEFFDLAPSYSGKVAMLDYQASVCDNVLKMLGKPAGSLEQADLDATAKVLADVKPHLLAISTEVGKAVAAGDAVMAMCDAYDAQLALTTNPNVVWVDPSEGQVGYLEGLAILDGPRNDLARAFVNFFLEEKNYASFINKVASPYVQPDNPGIDAVLKDSPVINPPADVVAKLTYHSYLGADQAKWDKVWDTFKAK